MVDRLTLNEIDGRTRSVVPSFASSLEENFRPQRFESPLRALIQKKHAFLDPPGVVDFPAPRPSRNKRSKTCLGRWGAGRSTLCRIFAVIVQRGAPCTWSGVTVR